MGFPLPITGGAPANDVAVVALAQGDTVACTGTVVAPHAVLTAAHCVTGTQLPEIAIGDTLAVSVRRAALAAFVHPDYDATTLDHDIALIVVEPMQMPSISIATTLAATPGATMRVVGYGWTVVNDTSPPRRRSGTSRIDMIDALRIVSSKAPAQTCEGDSGGPALFDAGTGEQVIGVASSGDSACSMFAKHTRVDAHADFVLDRVARSAPGAAAAGERCWYDANCSEGACLPARDEPRWSFCTPACTGGACPAGLECVDDRCVHALPSPGAGGARCASNADCAGALCLAEAGESQPVCTQHCFNDLPGFGCAGGESCRRASDGQEACFTVASDGCRSTRGNGLVVVLMLLYVLRGRGRP